MIRMFDPPWKALNVSVFVVAEVQLLLAQAKIPCDIVATNSSVAGWGERKSLNFSEMLQTASKIRTEFPPFPQGRAVPQTARLPRCVFNAVRRAGERGAAIPCERGGRQSPQGAGPRWEPGASGAPGSRGVPGRAGAGAAPGGGLGWVMLVLSTRGLSRCAVAAPERQPPLRSLLRAEERDGLGGGLRSRGVSDFLCKLWGNPFIAPEV